MAETIRWACWQSCVREKTDADVERAEFWLSGMHAAFFFIQGIFSMAPNKCSFSRASLLYVSMSNDYVSEWIFSMAI